MNAAVEGEIKRKIAFLVFAIMVNVLMALVMNPITVMLLFSHDRDLSRNFATSLLLICIFLLISSSFLAANIVLLRKNFVRMPNITINIVLTTYSLLSVAIFAELFLRATNPIWVPKQIYSYNRYFKMTWQKPDLDVNLRTSEYNVNFRTNSIGLREDKELTNKRDNEIRILAFGDSFIQAAQVEQEKTMCYIVERELNSLGAAIEFRVINLGTSGCGPEYQRRFLEENFDLFEADYLLLFIYVGNDIITQSSIRESNRTKIYNIWNSFVTNGKRLSYLFRVVFQERDEFPLGRPCQPFDGEPWERSANIFLKKYNRKIQDAYHKVFDEVSAIKEFCIEKNIGLCVFLIPTKEQVDKSKLDEVLRFFKIDAETLDMHKPQQIIADFLMRNGLMCVDLLPCLLASANETKKYFELDSHWNNCGNKVVADTVFSVLKKMISRI